MLLNVDPKVDFAFKRMVGKESTRPILIDLINNVLSLRPGYELKEVELLNPFNLKESAESKLSIVDIKARDQFNRQFNVEMQMMVRRTYPQRILYYGAKLYQTQIHEGQSYEELKPTISISFLNGVLFPQVPDFHLRFRLLEESHHFPLSTDVEFHILELPKFTKSLEQLATGLDAWLYFLRHADRIDTDAVPAALQRYPMLIRALEELKMMSQTELERIQYEARLRAQRDYNSDMKEAREEGREQGERIGVIQFCQRVLRQPQTPAEQLKQLSLEDLTRLADELQREVLKQP